MNKSLNLMIGSELRVSAQTQPERQYSMQLIGYAEAQSLLVKTSAQAQNRMPAKPGDPVVVQFMDGDNAFAFESRIQAVYEQPFPYLHLDYPQGVQGIMLRRSHRLPVAESHKPGIRLSMTDGREHLSVTLADISQAGACLSAGLRLGNIDDHFSIDLQPAGNPQRITLPCVIRYVRQEQQQGNELFHHGVQFAQLDQEAQLFIDRFIKENIEHHRLAHHG